MPAAAPATHATPRRLNADQLERYAHDGYLLIPGLIDPERIAAVRAAFGAVEQRMLATLAAEGLVRPDFASLPFETRFALAGAHANRFGRSWRREISTPAIFDLHHDPALLDVVQDLLGGDGVCGHRVYNARPKLPHQQITNVPWHQDSGYFGAESIRQSIVTAWVPLVNVDRANGCLQVARGSHDRYMEHRVEQADGKFLEIVAGEPPADRIVELPMVPGDVLLFGNLLWHRSLPNLSEQVRWSIDIRFYGESTPGQIGGESGPRWILRSERSAPTACAEWLRWMHNERW